MQKSTKKNPTIKDIFGDTKDIVKALDVVTQTAAISSTERYHIKEGMMQLNVLYTAALTQEKELKQLQKWFAKEIRIKMRIEDIRKRVGEAQKKSTTKKAKKSK
jgi:hypothetical protein